MSKNMQQPYVNEDIRDIVEVIPMGPTRNGLIFFIVVSGLLISLAWFIKYPEVISGQATVVTRHAPLDIVMPSSGSVIFLKDQGQLVEINENIGIVKNSSSYNDVIKLDQIIQSQKLYTSGEINNNLNFPEDLTLGDLQASYYQARNLYIQYKNFTGTNIYETKINDLTRIKRTYKTLRSNKSKELDVSMQSIDLYNKNLDRDSILLKKRVISQQEYELAKAQNLNFKRDFHTRNQDFVMIEMQELQADKNLNDFMMDFNDRKNLLRNEFISAYSQILTAMEEWKKKYILKSPVKGVIQILNHNKNNQFLAYGEPVINVIPEFTPLKAEVSIPSEGAGKILIGQRAILKLNDYPHEEFGFVDGKVKDISLNRTKDKDAKSYTQLVIEFKKFKTHMDKEIIFKSGMSGNVDIILKEKRLIHRFFDRINPLISKM